MFYIIFNITTIIIVIIVNIVFIIVNNTTVCLSLKARNFSPKLFTLSFRLT